MNGKTNRAEQLAELIMKSDRANRPHELLAFLAIHAARYQIDYQLNGLHPIHYDLMEKYGAPMERFVKATNIPESLISAGEREKS